MNNKKYLELIACFMIGLVLTIPFYVSSVMAQGSDDDIPDASQACMEKNEKTSELVELMDSGIIDYMEKIVTLLQAASTIWESFKFIYNTVILILWDIPPAIPDAKAKEIVRNIADNPFGGGLMNLIHYIVTCQTNIPISLCNIKIPTGQITRKTGSTYTLPLDPYSNIYTAISCFCLPGILTNLRRLEKMYQVYDCCVEQACSNGVSVETCEKEFSISECLFWGKGALVGTALGLITNIIFAEIVKRLGSEWITENIPYVGTVVSLGLGAFKINSLIGAIKRIQNVFTEPNCADLGFDKIKDEIKQQYTRQDCTYRPVDLNGDGIYDAMDNVCATQKNKLFDFYE
tara:strand:- start:495 stop:1532 length:1038 start_codon:yes stop_codon:yes gene_type:complete